MKSGKKLKTTSIFIDGVTLDPAATVIKVTGRRIVISAKGFAELTQALTSATRALDKVKTPEQLGAAMQAIQTIHNQHEKSAEVQAIINLTPDTCPANLKPAFAQAIKVQNELKDAAKRLMMGGVMRSDATSMPYGSFIAKFSLPDLAKDKPTNHEGAPKETLEKRDARMAWWRDGKFGMFIHYGLFSGLAGELQGKKYSGCVEWILQMSGLDSDTYAKEALPKFKPQPGKAEDWVKLAKEAGCTYTVLTSRHHEGFNLFESKFSDFNTKKAKDIDIVKEYSAACKKHNIKTGYYFSIIDWSHPDYDPTGSGISYPAGNYQAQKDGKRQFGNHAKYKEYLYNIFNELLTNYAPVDLVWWDFSQPNFQGDMAWNATKLMRNLFLKNPNAIQNNRLYHSDNHLLCKMSSPNGEKFCGGEDQNGIKSLIDNDLRTKKNMCIAKQRLRIQTRHMLTCSKACLCLE